MDAEFLDKVVNEIKNYASIDAIYLYGSRARGIERPDSDWDFAVLYTDFIKNIYESRVRPQLLESHLESHFKMYDKISVVDLELVPVPLQWNVIKGKKLYDRYVPHVRRVEASIISKVELDYL